MEVELTEKFFEWLLADCAGYGKVPGEVFPDLREIDSTDLADELVRSVQQAQLAKKAV